MLKFRYVFTIFIFFGMAIGLSQEVQSDSIEEVKSSLVFSELEYDFGKIKSDTIITHIYTFKNVSSDTININKVGTS